MKDYSFTYNTTSNLGSDIKVTATEDAFQLVSRDSEPIWDAVINGESTKWTLANRNPDVYTSYWDLSYDGEVIITYEFDMLSYLPNLIKIYMKIVSHEEQRDIITPFNQHT
jgi:hypothetical protein